MADEVTLSATLGYADSDGSRSDPLQVADLTADVATKTYQRGKQSIGTSAEAINLGDLTSLGWGIFINRDDTNYIELRTAVAGTYFAKLLPGECALFRFGSGVTAPYALANTAACQMEYLICSL